MKHTVEEVRLKNGARGLLIDVPDATVMSFQFHFRAGSRYVRDKDIYETAHIMEHMGLSQVGTHGTTAALALLNDAVKKGGMMACSRVGGLSGSFIPVSEDKGMIDAVRAGTMSVDKLEAMTAICSVGLDMVAIPGDTSAELIAGMIADEAAIGVMNHKTTAVRVIPVPGMGPGDQVDFGGLLGYAPIIPVSTVDNSEFIRRGGLIPAPVHRFRN